MNSQYRLTYTVIDNGIEQSVTTNVDLFALTENGKLSLTCIYYADADDVWNVERWTVDNVVFLTVR